MSNQIDSFKRNLSPGCSNKEVRLFTEYTKNTETSKNYSTPKYIMSHYEDGVKRSNDITKKINMLTSVTFTTGSKGYGGNRNNSPKRINANFNNNYMETRPNSNIKHKISELRRNMEAKMKYFILI